MKRVLFFLLLSVSGLSVLEAQYLSGFSARYDDDLSEWLVYPESEDFPECNIRCRWQIRQDPGEWDFRMGDTFGTIRTKWRNRYDDWEVIRDNQITRIRMVWPGDPREWRIESSAGEYVIQMEYNQPGSDWIVEKDRKVIFRCRTVYQNDIRDWITEDDLPEDEHFNTRVGLVFAVIISNVLAGMR